VVAEGVDTFGVDGADVELSVTVEELTSIFSTEVIGKVYKDDEFSRSRGILCYEGTIPITTRAV